MDVRRHVVDDLARLLAAGSGSSVHEPGRYSSRSMIPCPVSLA
jgi:hypothetical protein